MKERLQKIIAGTGYTSRRKAEELISAGRVSVNGRVAEIGRSADYDADEITIDGKRLPNMPKKVYIAMNKPRGFVTTADDEHGRKTVVELLESINCRVFPVGRLDMDSEGLLLLTNDGDWANKLAHPSYQIEKEYIVTVSGDTSAAIKTMAAGMDICGEDGEVEFHTTPARVRLVRDAAEGEYARLSLIIHEGHNRQVRRMCETCGLKVRRLQRKAIGFLTLDGIQKGKWRFLSDDEVLALTPPEKKPRPLI